MEIVLTYIILGLITAIISYSFWSKQTEWPAIFSFYDFIAWPIVWLLVVITFIEVFRD